MDISVFRNMYVSELQKRYKDNMLTVDDAAQTLDSLIDSINKGQHTPQEKKITEPKERTSSGDMITDILSNNRFVHLLGGKSKTPGFEFYEPIGSLEAHPDIRKVDDFLFYAGKQFEYNFTNAWADDELSKTKEFHARVFGRNIGNSYIFEMIYMDRTNDPRPGASVRYSLIIPNEEKASYVPEIAKDTYILVDLFKKVFPGHDNTERRGNGKWKITIDKDNSRIENYR